VIHPAGRQNPRRRLSAGDRGLSIDLPDLPLTQAECATINVLIIDDEESLVASTSAILDEEGYEVTSVRRGAEADSRLRQRKDDIVLLDWNMSGVPGTFLLRTALEARPDAIVVVMTGRPSIESSIDALRAGAWDYLPKPFSAMQLRVLVGRAAHAVIVSREAEAAHRIIPGSVTSAPALLGDSPLFRQVVSLARAVAMADASVFLTGPSGSGKEVIAQFIHRISRRRSRDIVAINCAALPDALLESEMFGHVQGAFTGATHDKVGLMTVASGGTLFLDELVEMSTMTQAKLLRVIQDGVVRRVGSSQSDGIVSVRFVSATNRDPETAIAQGRLREDLYYRLAVVPIHVPSLHERPEDIPILAEHFVSEYWQRHRGHERPPPRLTPAAMRDLEAREWKGNVRELQNVVEHAVVLVGDREEIDVSDLTTVGARPAGDSPIESVSAVHGPRLSQYHSTRDRVIERFEREYVTCLLRQTVGNVSQAARVAGINRATLYRMMQRHGLTKGEIVS
jgi:DNA-binding NtrC family response regulator